MRVVVTLIKLVRLPLGLRHHGPTGAFLHDVQRQQPKLSANPVGTYRYYWLFTVFDQAVLLRSAPTHGRHQKDYLHLPSENKRSERS